MLKFGYEILDRKKFTFLILYTKELTEKIRKLCSLDQEIIKRSISLPQRTPLTLYYLFKATRTGPTSYYMKPVVYFKKINVIRKETTRDWEYYDLLNHWNRIPPYRPWCPAVMIGEDRRINPMTGTTQRKIFHPKGRPYLLKNMCIYKIPCPKSKKNRKNTAKVVTIK